MVTVLRAPKTFTREDIVEIDCHGAWWSPIKSCNWSCAVGRVWPNRNFKRAFLNGRMDLSQAEAVMDLIRAKTDKAMDLALTQLDGNLSFDSQFAPRNLEYPGTNGSQYRLSEYDDVEELTTSTIRKSPKKSGQIDGLLQTAQQGKILPGRFEHRYYWPARCSKSAC